MKSWKQWHISANIERIKSLASYTQNTDTSLSEMGRQRTGRQTGHGAGAGGSSSRGGGSGGRLSPPGGPGTQTPVPGAGARRAGEERRGKERRRRTGGGGGGLERKETGTARGWERGRGGCGCPRSGARPCPTPSPHGAAPGSAGTGAAGCTYAARLGKASGRKSLPFPSSLLFLALSHCGRRCQELLLLPQPNGVKTSM